LVVTAATLVVQTYFGWYYAFHLAFALVVVLAWMRRERAPGVTPVPWLRLVLASAATLVAIAPGAWPYWLQHSSMAGFRRSLGKAVLYSADLMDYVKLNRENALAGTLGLPTGDLAYALGFVATVLAVVGVVMVVRGRVTGSLAALQPVAIARGFCALGLASFVLSLGPILQVAGHRLPVPLPYAALYFLIPGFTAMRAPGRFAGLVLIVGLVFAAWGFDAIRQRITGRLGRGLLFATTLALAGVLAWSSPIPLVTLPTADELPAAHRWIAQQPGEFAILELPMPASEAEEQERDARRQVWILYHGKRRVDGVSGFSSPAHEAFRRQMQDISDPEAVAAVIATGVRYVMVRYGEYPPDQVERIRSGLSAAREFVPVFESEGDVVYLIVAGELLAGGSLGDASEILEAPSASGWAVAFRAARQLGTAVARQATITGSPVCLPGRRSRRRPSRCAGHAAEESARSRCDRRSTRLRPGGRPIPTTCGCPNRHWA
jgi:hypothetical protein